VIVSTAISLALMRPLGVVGVVAGAVIAAWVETFALAWKLRARIGGVGVGRVPHAKIALVTAACVGGGLVARVALPAAFAASRLGGALVLGAFCVAFAIAAPATGLVRLGSLLRRRR
jgi:peptidoglycan biosynthesis protein MviN/MurJ (putative lipid II flippase)